MSESTFDCTFKTSNRPNMSNSNYNNVAISRLSPLENATSRTNFNISMNKSFYDNSKEVLESLTNVKSISPELKESRSNLNYDYKLLRNSKAEINQDNTLGYNNFKVSYNLTDK